MATEDYQAPSRKPAPRSRPGLVVVFPTTQVVRIPPGELLIGRDALAGLRVIDSAMSGQHARITRRGPAWFVEDLESRNGTGLDGTWLTPGERVRLDDGAVLRLGGTLLVFREELDGKATAGWPPELATTFGLEGVARQLASLVERPEGTVLVTGETGTGKEPVSRLIAQRLRPGRNIVPINVTGIAAATFEAQLFGHERNAFTGAAQAKRGVFEACNGGCVILDELGELPLDLQPKLLRVIENREVQPVGATAPRKVDVLIIGTTQRDLQADVAAGRFRADLLARFHTHIELPPLRERREDVFAIMQALVARRNERYEPTQVDVNALERLLLEPWPNNVRDLYTALASIARGAPPPALYLQDVERVLGPSKTRQPLTREAATRALDAAGGVKSKAAKMLNVSRGTFLRVLDGK